LLNTENTATLIPENYIGGILRWMNQKNGIEKNTKEIKRAHKSLKTEF
jgi:hypothetical protein